MEKKKQPITSQEKSRRRVLVMDKVAQQITSDKSMTWRRYETIIKSHFEDGYKIKVDFVK